jgi:hypothetical protein
MRSATRVQTIIVSGYRLLSVGLGPHFRFDSHQQGSLRDVAALRTHVAFISANGFQKDASALTSRSYLVPVRGCCGQESQQEVDLWDI